jgi:hypothetical protein
MHWFTSKDGTRFLVQTPLECAHSIARAFPDMRAAATSRRFMAQVKTECPPPEREPLREPAPSDPKPRHLNNPNSC